MTVTRVALDCHLGRIAAADLPQYIDFTALPPLESKARGSSTDAQEPLASVPDLSFLVQQGGGHKSTRTRDQDTCDLPADSDREFQESLLVPSRFQGLNTSQVSWGVTLSPRPPQPAPPLVPKLRLSMLGMRTSSMAAAEAKALSSALSALRATELDLQHSVEADWTANAGWDEEGSVATEDQEGLEVGTLAQISPS